MKINLIYLITLAAAFGLLLFWKIYRLLDVVTRRTIIQYARKKLLYTLIYRRRASSDNVNVLSLFNICLILAANVTACGLKINNRAELAKRCGSLFLVNLIPLLLGGQRSFLTDRFLHLQSSEQSLLHRWMGRVCVVQGLVHGIVNATSSSPATLQILCISFLVALGTLSSLYIRQHVYEIFLKTHLLFALALVGILWFHVPHKHRQSMVCLAVASGLWIVQECVWFGRLGYRNFRSRHAKGMSLIKHSSGSAEAVEVTLTLKKPWNVRPGEFVYLTLPVLGRHHGGFAQAHPYTIAWTDGSDITLLVQRHTGFSNDLFTTPKDLSSCVVDGPYGYPQLLTGYDKVLFAASGIGVAAHLLDIRALLRAHEDQSARVRRVTLLWFLESPGQEEWAKRFLSQLLEMDKRHIFTLALYIPSHGSNNWESATSVLLSSDRCFRTSKSLDLRWYIDAEARSEAGNMAISVCGTPHFEEAVRRAVRENKHDICISNASFRPEGTTISEQSQQRYS